MFDKIRDKIGHAILGDRKEHAAPKQADQGAVIDTTDKVSFSQEPELEVDMSGFARCCGGCGDNYLEEAKSFFANFDSYLKHPRVTRDGKFLAIPQDINYNYKPPKLEGQRRVFITLPPSGDKIIAGHLMNDSSGLKPIVDHTIDLTKETGNSAKPSHLSYNKEFDPQYAYEGYSPEPFYVNYPNTNYIEEFACPRGRANPFYIRREKLFEG